MKNKQIARDEWFTIKTWVEWEQSEHLSKKLAFQGIEHTIKQEGDSDYHLFLIQAWLPNATHIYTMIKEISRNEKP